MPDILLAAQAVGVRQGRRILLESISFQLEAGEVVTLIGPNGAGKTTLVRALIGALVPTTGRIEKRAGLRIGYTPQKMQLEQMMPMPVARFLALAGRVDAARRATVLEQTRTSAMTGAQLRDLSGGEMQRVLLARALLRAPHLLILDEPTQGLDQPGEARFYALLAEIRAQNDMAVFMVSHDLHVVMAQADRVICLNRHICCQGAPAAISEDPAYRAMFGDRAALAVYRHDHDHSHDHSHGHSHGHSHAQESH
ncbi:ATP-binding cassette domain-containing protein [Abyssibius alkaniclasticus]|uniref:ATP-binding cassette domain-containing protein n=1 Tax=Abyssibius alkaniclasticus TaxID=2881234 RepID=UPI0023639474|nr:ATP-binding cassette domain-containing protein [Abyssibius alkaniclasticus]UPH71651.1 ATP-binding cassette domain-containing protein [Abyssibius alkaniclasticus]